MRFDPLTKASLFRFKLYPKDFALVKKFYEETLKYPIFHEWDDGEQSRGVMFDSGSAIIELLSHHGRYVPVAGCNVSLEVVNVWKLAEYLKAQRAPVVQDLTDNSWGDTSFKVSDPEGLEVTFFTETAKKTREKEFFSFNTIMQIGLTGFTMLGFILTSLKLPQYGLLANLISEFFWIYAGYKAWRSANQFGIFITTIVITLIVINGVINYWFL